MTELSRKVFVTVERATSLVLRTLKRTFPDDFDRRCFYAAAGTRHLLGSAGIDARIHAGDFCALVVSKDGSRAGLQGFGGATESLTFSHYWVETASLLVDLGPHLLPKGSSFPAAPIPILAWNKHEPLLSAFRYRLLERYLPDAEMRFPEDISLRMTSFLSNLSERWARKRSSTSVAWLLTSENEAIRAARRDVWAAGVLRFEREVNTASLPF